MNVKREAAKDAAEYVAASMAYGEGAGTRRKLIQSAAEFKMYRVPGYADAFERAVESQDVVKSVRRAKSSRRVKDVSKFAGKNTKALMTGEPRNMSPVVYASLITLVVAHQTGYDKKALAYLKRKKNDVHNWMQERTVDR